MPSIYRSTPIHIAMRDAMLREAADISRDANLPAAQAQVLFTVVAWGRMGDDGWSVYSDDGSLAAHFEFTVAVGKDGPRVLTPWHEEED